jgi:hypothetical protein
MTLNRAWYIRYIHTHENSYSNPFFFPSPQAIVMNRWDPEEALRVASSELNLRPSFFRRSSRWIQTTFLPVEIENISNAERSSRIRPLGHLDLLSMITLSLEWGWSLTKNLPSGILLVGLSPESKFLVTKFEFGGSFDMSLEGDCHKVEVTPNLKLSVTFGKILEGVCHELYT